jgi:hypothetical protein
VHSAIGRQRKMQLVHLPDGTATIVMDDFQVPPEGLHYNGDFAPLRWSLNDAYLAFYTWDQSAETQDLYVYDVESQSLTDLSGGGTSQYEVAFSLDSTRLAFINDDCSGGGCSISLDLYETQTFSLIDSIDVGLVSGIGAEGACELHWSEDNAYVAFAAPCDYSALGATAEVYVAEVATGIITAATARTPTNVEPSRSTYTANFDLIWVDSTKLLISVFKTEGTMPDFAAGTVEPPAAIPPTVETVLYYVDMQSTVALSGTQWVGWPETQGDLWATVRYFYEEFTGLAVSIDSFNGEYFVDVVSGPGGCNLQWNASFRILAYVPASLYACNTEQKIHFIDAKTDTLSTRELGPRDDALGWLTLPRQTFDALPTPAPSGLG